MDKQTPQELIDKYLTGNATAEEKATVESWYLMRSGALKDLLPEPDYAALGNNMWPVIDEQTVPLKKTAKLWPRIAGIAAAVIGIALCVWLFRPAVILNLFQDPALAVKNDIAPGHNGATLTFAGGETINLSDKKNGIIVGDALKYDDGSTVNDRHPELVSGSPHSLVTATTAKGQTYSIILQDGTKVWLNADSKLEFYPNYRNKLQRIVKLIKGEAYLEVAKDAKRPFIVKSQSQEIEVLGTHFNVSAYTDDTGTKTTLLEGSVRVAPLLSSRANAKDLNTDPSEVGMTKRRDGEAVTLKPNQQSLLSGNTITIKQVNASETIAWKNGVFRFNNASLEEVMRQLARWYDVEIVYPNGIPKRSFTGDMDRSLTAAKALSLLQFMKVKFKIAGKQIIVTK